MKSLNWRLKLAIALAFSMLAGGCAAPAAPATPAPAAAFVLSSSAFRHSERIPVKYTQQGDNVSPPLSWSVTPSGTQSFALMTEDMDGPSGIIVHWVMFNIPSSIHELAEAVPVQDQLDSRALQGSNVRGGRGYIGPSPPVGTTHRYEFTLFALDQPLSLNAGASRAELVAAMQGHIVAVTQLMGIYQRQ